MGIADWFTADTAPLKNSLNDSKKLGKKARREITYGENKSLGYQEQALPLWDDLINKGKEGVEGYGTYDPRRGQAGYDDLTQSLDYLASRGGAQQGLDSIARIRNGAGMLFSGNTLTDAMDYMHKYDTDILANARNYFQPYFGLYGQGTAGKSGVYQGMGNTAMQGGMARGQTYMDLVNPTMQTGENIFNANQNGLNNAWNFALGLGNIGAKAYRGTA